MGNIQSLEVSHHRCIFRERNMLTTVTFRVAQCFISWDTSEHRKKSIYFWIVSKSYLSHFIILKYVRTDRVYYLKLMIQRLYIPVNLFCFQLVIVWFMSGLYLLKVKYLSLFTKRPQGDLDVTAKSHRELRIYNSFSCAVNCICEE